MTDIGVLAPSGGAPIPQSDFIPRDEKEARAVDALTKSGGLVAQAAQALGCSRQALHQYIEARPDLKALQATLKHRLLDIAEGHLYKGVIAGEWDKVKYLLDSQARERGYGQKLLTPGEGGVAVAVAVQVSIEYVAPPVSHEDEEPIP